MFESEVWYKPSVNKPFKAIWPLFSISLLYFSIPLLASSSEEGLEGDLLRLHDWGLLYCSLLIFSLSCLPVILVASYCNGSSHLLSHLLLLGNRKSSSTQKKSIRYAWHLGENLELPFPEPGRISCGSVLVLDLGRKPKYSKFSTTESGKWRAFIGLSVLISWTMS